MPKLDIRTTSKDAAGYLFPSDYKEALENLQRSQAQVRSVSQIFLSSTHPCPQHVAQLRTMYPHMGKARDMARDWGQRDAGHLWGGYMEVVRMYVLDAFLCCLTTAAAEAATESVLQAGDPMEEVVYLSLKVAAMHKKGVHPDPPNPRIDALLGYTGIGEDMQE